MNFLEVIKLAKQNTSTVGQHGESRYYTTKFSPPKKEAKEKKLSDNIKKFLAKKDEEERAKVLEQRRKAQELMEQRDGKAKKKIEKMLKVIKSANKSVMDDAGQDNGELDQPDEDDYGYTSNVASQFYKQLMDKYKNNPEKEKFKEAEKRTMNKEDLAQTKARVKDAITRQVEEEQMPRSRKARTVSDGGRCVSNQRDPGTRCNRVPERSDDPVEEQRRTDVDIKRSKLADKKSNSGGRKPSGPPPPDFKTLIKLAEQKQYEPVKVDVVAEKKTQEPERLMTKKEKQEHEERMAFQEMRRLRDRIKDDPKLSDKEKEQKLMKLEALRAAGKLPGIPPTTGVVKPSFTGHAAFNCGGSWVKSNQQTGDSGVRSSNDASGTGGKFGAALNYKPIPKMSERRTEPQSKESSVQPTQHQQASSAGPKVKPLSVPRTAVSSPKIVSATAGKSLNMATSTSKMTSTDVQLVRCNKIQTVTSTITSKVPGIVKSKSCNSSATSSTTASSAIVNAPRHLSSKSTTNSSIRNSQSATKPVAGVSTKRPLQPELAKTRQFPPSDVQRSVKRPSANSMDRGHPSRHGGGTSGVKKRRVIDSDTEHDSEMDDFIDDGDCEEDYSSAIKEIFGYDKSRYQNDDYEADDDNMESTYAQQMREEFISKKIGIMEDLEDMRMEEEEKRRKMVKKKASIKKR
ncbi:protein SPT2 homolog [Anopheles bellator]|uniref:protein SPT2 homolog n=1 Tax=Anopheles bellator TaxID=139047 RepID=UPI0026499AE2|nr:protein SPT2 homolog [Anopheles bellator]XP_058064360.1 protein SPT2 homolog [Anopheles bellator]